MVTSLVLRWNERRSFSRGAGKWDAVARVLVVDDDADIRDWVSEALSLEGHDVVAAANGAVALEVLEAQLPDVVLLDLWMPVLDGFAFARRCWERFGDQPPIIVMSAHLRKLGDLDIHVAAFLPKPFDFDSLLALVEQFAA